MAGHWSSRCGRWTGDRAWLAAVEMILNGLPERADARPGEATDVGLPCTTVGQAGLARPPMSHVELSARPLAMTIGPDPGRPARTRAGESDSRSLPPHGLLRRVAVGCRAETGSVVAPGSTPRWAALRRGPRHRRRHVSGVRSGALARALGGGPRHHQDRDLPLAVHQGHRTAGGADPDLGQRAPVSQGVVRRDGAGHLDDESQRTGTLKRARFCSHSARSSAASAGAWGQVMQEATCSPDTGPGRPATAAARRRGGRRSRPRSRAGRCSRRRG
jgi:hypothetical protein